MLSRSLREKHTQQDVHTWKRRTRKERRKEREGGESERRRETGERKGESGFKEFIMDDSLHRQSDRQRRRSSQKAI